MRWQGDGRRNLVAGLVLGAVVASPASAGAAAPITGQQIKDGTITRQDLAKAIQGQLDRAGTPSPPTGPAGGSLAGRYPNPRLKAPTPMPIRQQPAAGS